MFWENVVSPGHPIAAVASTVKHFIRSKKNKSEISPLRKKAVLIIMTQTFFLGQYFLFFYYILSGEFYVSFFPGSQPCEYQVQRLIWNSSHSGLFSAFQANQGQTVRPCLKTKTKTHTKPNTWEDHYHRHCESTPSLVQRNFLAPFLTRICLEHYIILPGRSNRRLLGQRKTVYISQF